MRSGEMRINQRRYLGSKTGVLDLIDEVVKNEIGEFDSFCDIFTGTGVVGNHFNREEVRIITNDILYSNFIVAYAWFSDAKYDKHMLKELIEEFNEIVPCEENYFSINFGGKYFSVDTAKKIGLIREKIEDLKINLKEKAILLTSLVYSMDKIANTVGHYDAYREKVEIKGELELRFPFIKDSENTGNLIYNRQANELIREIECDVLYLDPPYNSRQYCDTYHLLENIVRWEKPQVKGKARKFDRTNLKSDYNTIRAKNALSDLIENANCRYIMLSYNNMGKKGHSRSNARIKDNELIEILSKRGKVEIFEKEYKAFSSGKSNIDGNIERIFLVKVTEGMKS